MVQTTKNYNRLDRANIHCKTNKVNEKSQKTIIDWTEQIYTGRQIK